MDLGLGTAVIAGRLAGRASRLLGRGGGTALPGIVAGRFVPDYVSRLAAQLPAGSVVVSGTNGKTTTSRMVAAILRAAGTPVLHNREGSNMMRGLGSTLLASATITGRLRVEAGTIGVFEVDEANMPAAVAALRPRVLAFTNLFRDQLDRYGEVDTVAALWREALAAAPADATLVLNADDPSVAEVAVEWPGQVHWFGLDDPALATGTPVAADARWCRACGGSFRYARRYFAHAGFWRCEGCGRARAMTDTTGRAVRLQLDAASFAVDGLGELATRLTGAYNVTNALAAIGVARVLGVAPDAIRRGLASTGPAFGRQENVDFGGRALHLLLTKNPAGANEVIRLLAAVAPPEGLQVAALLNNRFADGQDVSWIWDVDYEAIASRVTRCWTAGDRAEDMALRLTYARWPAPDAVMRTAAELLDAMAATAEARQHLFVIPTYTAMLELRAELVRRGFAQPFWE